MCRQHQLWQAAAWVRQLQQQQRQHHKQRHWQQQQLQRKFRNRKQQL
jgi:hypothetical protein